MDPEGPYFLGKEIGMPDIALAPWVGRFFMVEKFKQGGTGIPAEGAGGEDEKVWNRWRKWVKAITARESFKNTFSERQYYENIATQEWAR
ncbi:hypothetical protein ACJ72_06350 [Emergomyces africanus]|uniref:GST C-terminal domain-containing protein n=1 Tax=Emergomyces africanus TaxID=1955775 RepID=A0A1B7NRB3_9EURO|nr:hypothetical protein ACJ72_06350 [Emergomyces africanus]